MTNMNAAGQSPINGAWDPAYAAAEKKRKADQEEKTGTAITRAA
jgi:hypothetical protein